MTTGSELEEVEAVDRGGLDTRQVAERLGDAGVLTKDNERATALAVTTVPELALASTKLARVGCLLNTGVRAKSLQSGDSLLDLDVLLDRVVKSRANLCNLSGSGMLIACENRCENERGRGTPGERGAGLGVSYAPNLGRCKHVTAATHVAKRGLIGAVGTTATNTRDTRHYGVLANVRQNSSVIALSVPTLSSARIIMRPNGFIAG